MTATDRSTTVTVVPHWYPISEELLRDWYPTLLPAAELTPAQRALALLRPHLARIPLYQEH